MVRGTLQWDVCWFALKKDMEDNGPQKTVSDTKKESEAPKQEEARPKREDTPPPKKPVSAAPVAKPEKTVQWDHVSTWSIIPSITSQWNSPYSTLLARQWGQNQWSCNMYLSIVTFHLLLVHSAINLWEREGERDYRQIIIINFNNMWAYLSTDKQCWHCLLLLICRILNHVKHWASPVENARIQCMETIDPFGK